MAQIYTNGEGVQVYDNGGKTYNAKTGAEYVSPNVNPNPAMPGSNDRVSRIAARTDGGAQPGADPSKAGTRGYDVFGNKVADSAAPAAAAAAPASAAPGSEQALAEGLAANAGQPKTYEQILKEKTDAANAAIDAIRQQFNEVIGQDTQLGAQNAARVRASNVSAGLAGSDFASSAAATDAGKTAAVIKADQARRDAQINAILTGIPNQADEAFAKAQDAYRTNAEAGITALKNFRDNQKSHADATLAAIAASGASFDSLKSSSGYQNLLDAYGGSEDAVKGAFISAIPKDQQVGTTTVGNKYIVFYRDPVSGSQNMVSYDLPQNLGTDESVQQVFSNGQVAIKSTKYDAQGNKQESIRIETPPGFAGTPGSNSKQLTQDLNDAEQALTFGIQGTPWTAGRGADGYVDPGLYVALYNQFDDAGKIAFLKKFPPQKSINPDNVGLGNLPTPIENAVVAGKSTGGTIQ